MTKVTIYSIDYCGPCKMAKDLLHSKGVEVDDINLTDDIDAIKELAAKTGQKGVPQIFIGDEFIGGFTELRTLAMSGKLEALLDE